MTSAPLSQRLNRYPQSRDKKTARDVLCLVHFYRTGGPILNHLFWHAHIIQITLHNAQAFIVNDPVVTEEIKTPRIGHVSAYFNGISHLLDLPRGQSAVYLRSSYGRFNTVQDRLEIIVGMPLFEKNLKLDQLIADRQPLRVVFETAGQHKAQQQNNAAHRGHLFNVHGSSFMHAMDEPVHRVMFAPAGRRPIAAGRLHPVGLPPFASGAHHG